MTILQEATGALFIVEYIVIRAQFEIILYCGLAVLFLQAGFSVSYVIVIVLVLLSSVSLSMHLKSLVKIQTRKCGGLI